MCVGLRHALSSKAHQEAKGISQNQVELKLFFCECGEDLVGILESDM